MAQVRWRSRPRDTRYKDANSLYQAAKRRKARCEEATIRNKEIEVLAFESPSDAKGQIQVRSALGKLTPTYWSFGQLCSRSGWRAVDLRRIHADLIKLNVEYGLAYLRKVQHLKVLSDQRYQIMRALTGPGFGRVWDCDLLDLLQPLLDLPKWRMPADLSTDMMNAIGYFSSDQDMYIFLVSSEGSIEISTPGGSERLKRGLMITNSEVGASSLILSTFLFRSICSNRMIFGLQKACELKRRHTRGLPDCLEDVIKEFLACMEREPYDSVAVKKVLQRAMNRRVAEDDDGVEAWLTRRGFTIKRVKSIIAKARQTEEGYSGSIWDLVQGGTAVAAEEKNADKRFAMEKQVSRLLTAA